MSVTNCCTKLIYPLSKMKGYRNCWVARPDKSKRLLFCLSFPFLHKNCHTHHCYTVPFAHRPRHRDRHSAHHTNGSLAALRNGPDGGAVQVRLLRGAALHPDPDRTQARRGAEHSGRTRVHQHQVSIDEYPLEGMRVLMRALVHCSLFTVHRYTGEIGNDSQRSPLPPAISNLSLVSSKGAASPGAAGGGVTSGGGELPMPAAATVGVGKHAGKLQPPLPPMGGASNNNNSCSSSSNGSSNGSSSSSNGSGSGGSVSIGSANGNSNILGNGNGSISSGNGGGGGGNNMRKSNFYSDSLAALKQQQQQHHSDLQHATAAAAASSATATAAAAAGKQKQVMGRPGLLKLLTSPIIFQPNTKTFPKTWAACGSNTLPMLLRLRCRRHRRRRAKHDKWISKP